MKPRLLPLYLCFFISGISALIYEIVWQRMLTLVFGLSTFSVAAVVAAFLAGLALGARLFAGWADRTARPLRLYAGIELAVGALGLASGFFVPPLMRVFTTLYTAAEPGWLGSNLIRFGLACATLGVPGIVIGATVPVMARLVAERVQSVAVGFGRFYAVNTIGSVAGAALAGFVLIPGIGVHNTLRTAVAGNLLIVVGLALGAGRELFGPAKTEARSTAPAPTLDADARPPRRVLGLAAATGAVALAYEIAWTRVLAIFTFNSVYVFTMVVTVYLTALALGATVAARLMQARGINRLRTLIGVQVALALLGPIAFACLPAARGLALTNPTADTARLFIEEYGLALALVFPPTVLIGMTLPLLVGMVAATPGGAGRTVGRLYAWNAAGTILGAAVTGTLLIPLLGLRGTLLGLAAVSFLIAAVAATWDAPAPRGWRGVTITQFAAGAFVLLVAVLPPVTRLYRPSEAGDETVLYYAEGPSATVHVSEIANADGNYRQLMVDSKAVAGTYPEIVTDQKLLAHLPLLLHPNPQRALTVGFGTGGTSYSMLQHKIHVDCVEIEPRVPEAYRLFESENHGLVGPNHERGDFHLVLDDARAWLQVAPIPYDVIVTDVTSIQYRGNGNLYTTDYFRLMQARLAPGGLGCAWVPISGITPEQLKILVRSFQAVYPHTSVWYMINLANDFVILVGTPERLAIELDDIARRLALPLIKKDLAPLRLDNPYKMLAGLLLAEDDVTAYVDGGPLHTDDRPVLDYLTHATSYRNTLSANLTEMLAHRTNTAAYVRRWPPTDPPSLAEARWHDWYVAAGHLLEGHAWICGFDPNRVASARAAYRAAAALIPDDATIRELVEGLETP